MATLSQVYSNLAVGVFVSSTCYALFGTAIRTEKNSNLTPRAWARPVEVLKNCLSPPYSLNWIVWAMSLRYIDLLAGIPGTGTRRKGWSGPNLKTNLDGIVLLRYHTLQFKVSLFATILCMMLLLPMYYTVECDPLRSGRQYCEQHSKNTDFEQLTIANVVPHGRTSIVYKNGTSVSNANPYNYNVTNLNDIDVINSIKLGWHLGVTERYLALTCVIALVTIYSCYLLWHEWIECLALRRVYYLESEYYEERLDELDEIRTNTDPEDPFQKIRPPFLPHPEMRETIPNVALHSVLYKLPSNLKTNFDSSSKKSLLERQLEAAVDFFDQCIPNQPGYTSSIAAITMIPDATKMTKVWGKWYVCGNKMRRLRYIQYNLERRRAMQEAGKLGVHDILVAAPVRAAKLTAKATVETLEVVKEKAGEGIEVVRDFTAERMETLKELAQQHNCTNQVELSSPMENQVSGISAFVGCREEEFFDAATKDSNDDDGGDGSEEQPSRYPPSSTLSLLRGNETTQGDISLHSGEGDIECAHQLDSPIHLSDIETPSEIGDVEQCSDGEEKGYEVPFLGESSIGAPGFRDDAIKDRFEYDEFDPVAFSKWIGYAEETKLDQIVDTLDIEQLTVYSREMSQSASNCCVYGCSPHTIHLHSVEQLEVMLEDAWEAAREANAELLVARAAIMNEKRDVMRDEGRKEENDPGESNIKHANCDSNDELEGMFSRVTNAVQGLELDSKNETIHNYKDTHHKANRLRKRGKRNGRVQSTRAKYDEAQKLVKELNAISTPISEYGEEKFGCCHDARVRLLRRDLKDKADVVESHLDHPSYCVVTFTSRQAAIAARQCLPDGKGTKAWTQVQNIPMHPLADAPPRNICFCRGCCRPVALTISDKEKRTRKIVVWTFFVFFCFLYTVPLTLTAQLLNPTLLAERYPNTKIFQDPNSFFFRVLAGISTGYIYTLFFSVLPQIFKLMAFSEGSSSSKVIAEEYAMRFYWYFMLVTSFFSQYLLQMLIDGILQGEFGTEFKDILSTVAASIATSQAPTWVNWIIVRAGTTLPMNYLLQSMTFVYGWLGIPCLNRVMRGGGPGGPPPYRIYIDSGVVFMCLTSLAPACPILAPICLLYYAIFIPMLRWLHIFVYRPFYDGGGNRLPIIHEIIISSLILSHILLGTVLILKQSFIFGILVVLMSLPTFIFSLWTKEKFQRSYEDAGLWQTSKLDGLANKTKGNMQEREKYRRWLVDAHKASYVPICMSGGQDFLTNQPAVVVPLDRHSEGYEKKLSRTATDSNRDSPYQKGAICRRYVEP